MKVTVVPRCVLNLGVLTFVIDINVTTKNGAVYTCRSWKDGTRITLVNGERISPAESSRLRRYSRAFRAPQKLTDLLLHNIADVMTAEERWSFLENQVEGRTYRAAVELLKRRAEAYLEECK